ncbi:MAG: uncharacterized protein PWQ10_84 [Patescibacteria group bacterium]|nr:uncharacterized protein [Patescibacteria group bacterium]
MIYNVVSPYLVAIIIAWIGAHAIKYIIGLTKNNTYKFSSYLFMSGGMPSSHTATVMALTTVIGFCNGFGSGLFGLSMLVALIVMYDAMKVRRSSGEQGAAIKELIKEQRSNVKNPRVSNGHTPLEVAIGALLGITIGYVVFLSAI